MSHSETIDSLLAPRYVECGLCGAAAFKRRLLRSCGWRVVTVSFNESAVENGADY